MPAEEVCWDMRGYVGSIGQNQNSLSQNNSLSFVLLFALAHKDLDYVQVIFIIEIFFYIS